jgi:hypothetical protein
MEVNYFVTSTLIGQQWSANGRNIFVTSTLIGRG